MWCEGEGGGRERAASCDIAPGPKVDGGAKSWQKRERKGHSEEGRGRGGKSPHCLRGHLLICS